MESPDPASATNSSRSPHRMRLALEHVYDALQVAVVVGARLGVGVDCHRARPKLLRAHTRDMPGVCGVLELRLLAGMTATPVCFHFGAEGSSGVAGAELVDAIVTGV
jgi:hypothetical protein